MGGELTADLPLPRHFEPQVNNAAWVTSAALVAGLAENRFQVIEARTPVSGSAANRFKARKFSIL
jgi:hypothetical protein